MKPAAAKMNSPGFVALNSFADFNEQKKGAPQCPFLFR